MNARVYQSHIYATLMKQHQKDSLLEPLQSQEISSIGSLALRAKKKKSLYGQSES